jgi:predicted AAA+ superfamily ATPase
MEKQTAKQILLEQQEEIRQIFREKLITREIASDARKALSDNIIKAIIGVRRCGKSVLAHQILKGKKYGYINFDDERLLGTRTEDLNKLLEVLLEVNPKIKYILLDEVQNVQGWELFVNRLGRKGYNIVITGSNSNLLSKELATHLTGRHIVFELYPFSFREFLKYQAFSYSDKYFYIAEKKSALNNKLEEYIQTGGLPEIYKIKFKDRYLRDLFDKIITRDVVTRYSVKYVKDLKEIALFLISNFSGSISYRKLTELFNLGSVHTIKNYVSYLEEAYLIFQLNPFSFKLKNVIRQNKKIYTIDTGMINAVAPQLSPNTGRMIENTVFLELKRRKKDIYYLTKQHDYEVDFVVKANRKVTQLIQVCYNLDNLKTKQRELKGLIKASNKLNCSDLLVINEGYEGEEKHKEKKIRFTPLSQWLLRKH